MFKYVLILAIILQAFSSLASPEHCPTKASHVIPMVQSYVEQEIDNNGRVRKFSFIGVPELALPQIKLLTEDEKKEKEAFKKLGFDFDKVVGKGDFKTKFEFVMRPGNYENIFIPILGLAFKIDKHTIIYACTIWDETDLDKAIMKIFFLRTNHYKTPELKRDEDGKLITAKILVEPNTGNLYVFPVSNIVEVFEKFSYKIFKRKLFIAFANSIIRKIEEALYKIQNIFLRVGVSQVTVTKDRMKLNGALGVLVAQFDLLKLNRELKDMWWREYLRGENIFAEITEKDIQDEGKK